MARQDSLSDDELEALLDLAEKGPKKKEKVIPAETDVERYIKKYNIESGDTFISSGMIYYHYWKSKQSNKMTKGLFFKRFRQYFEQKHAQRERGYYLNPEPFDLSQDGYWQSRRFFRNKKNAKKN